MELTKLQKKAIKEAINCVKMVQTKSAVGANSYLKNSKQVPFYEPQFKRYQELQVTLDVLEELTKGEQL